MTSSDVTFLVCLQYLVSFFQCATKVGHNQVFTRGHELGVWEEGKGGGGGGGAGGGGEGGGGGGGGGGEEEEGKEEEEEEEEEKREEEESNSLHITTLPTLL